VSLYIELDGRLVMTYAAFLDLLSAWLGLISALLFSLGVLQLKDQSLQNIASLAYDSGEQVAVELAQQKVDFQFGASFLALSFLSQIGPKLFPSLQNINAFSSFWVGSAVSLGASIFLVGFSFPVLRRKRKLAEEKVRRFNK